MEFAKLEIASLTEAQLCRMEQLENTCGLEPFSREMLLGSVAQMDTYAMLDGGMIAGFITLYPSTRYLGGGLYMVNLNVAPEYRRQGIATGLILAACSAYACTHLHARVTLDVRMDNAPAMALYRKLGFAVTDEPSGNGDTDVVMAVSLKNLLGIIPTPRLLLKRITVRDAREGIELYRDERVNKTYMFPDLTQDAARKLHHRLCAISADDSRFIRGIYLDNKLIGFINDPEIGRKTLELGWVVAPEYQNRGFATEAVKAAIRDLFCRGFDEVTAGAFEENPASIRVMEKCGMHQIDKTEDIDYRGTNHHCLFYSVGK